MTLRSDLDTIGWSGRQLARMLGEDDRKIRRWIAGDQEAPRDVVAWIEELAFCHMAYPVPVAHVGKS